MSQAAKVQGKIAAAALAVIMAVTLVSGGGQAFVERPHAEAQAERIATERHFWNAIAGRESSASASVENQLAMDLAASEDLSSFRGNSNRYGGITDAIGYDPFDGSGQNCSECGPLKSEVRTKVELAKAGKVDQVLSSVPAPPDTSTLSLTPFGFSLVVYAFVLWVLIGYTSYIAAQVIAKERWGSDLRAWLTAPLVALAVTLQRHNKESEVRERIASAFPDAIRTIDEVDKFLRRLPDGETKRALRAQRDEVQAELQRQSAGDDSDRDEVALRNMTDSLAAVQEALKLKTEVMESLNDIDRHSGLSAPMRGQSRG